MIAAFVALLLVPALPQAADARGGDRPAIPAATGAGDWQLFHSTVSGGQQFDYYYDKAGVVSSGEKVTVTLRVLGKPANSVTYSSIELNCRAVTFTEMKTVSTDGEGHRTELPAADLWHDAPIVPGKSADKLRRLLCR